jgi:coenzyme F420-reducing hydrogenase beta subunit
MYLETWDKKECCGCKVCEAVCTQNAIQFMIDEEGFWFPRINETRCIHCGKCRKACTFANIKLQSVLESNKKAFACYYNNEEVLKKSSSGGIFTYLSDFVLKNKGVVYGHYFNKDIVCECGRGKTRKKRNLFCGSKYVQSNVRPEIYVFILNDLSNGIQVLFSGTPCQVNALYSYLGRDYVNLFTVSILCHGVHSPKLFEEYKKYLEIKNGKIKEINFRSKEKGWNNPSSKVIYDNKVVISSLYKDPYFLLIDKSKRISCSACLFQGYIHNSDITIGDFWGIDAKNSVLFNENKGCSVAIINTKKGENIFGYRKSVLTIENIPIMKALEKNIISNIPVFYDRKQLYKDVFRNSFDFVYKRYLYPSFYGKVRKRIRRYAARLGIIK